MEGGADVERHDHARSRGYAKRGGGGPKISLEDDLEGAAAVLAAERAPDLVALDEALDRLAAIDPVKADLLKLRYFAGLNQADAAAALGLSDRTAGRYWTYARAWLRSQLEQEQ